jgi:GTPase SAR1 family protein
MVMIGSKLKRYRDSVIELYESYLQSRDGVEDGVDIDILESRIQSIKKGKFTLLVAGEVKAGKSTFINALLGSEILPSDVLQATSAIIEIAKADKPCVRVEYADGQIKAVEDDPATPFIDESRVFLSQICSIQDKYRSVPISLLDDLIVRFNVQSIDDIDIPSIEASSGLRLSHLVCEIRDYINERKIEQIPVKIQYEYPLKWEFDELQIVDSPGVNARGGLQDLTFSYMEQANAILFVHPIKPIESQSFREFVDRVIADRSKDFLFLVLTHAGLYDDDQVTRLHQEAINLYSDIIDKDRILVVDSLLRLISLDLSSGLTIDQIKIESPEKKKLLYSYKARSDDEKVDMIELIRKDSRFDLMESAIDHFGSKAPLLQLSSVVSTIKSGLVNVGSDMQSRISRLELKKKPQQEFEKEIANVEELIGKYKLTMNKAIEAVHQRFSGTSNTTIELCKELRRDYIDLLNDSETEDDIRKHYTDFVDKLDRINQDYAHLITSFLKDECTKIGTDFNTNEYISIPVIDIDQLAEKSKFESYKDEEIKEERTRTEQVDNRKWYNLWKFWEADKAIKYTVVVGHRRVFMPSEYINSLRFNITKNINDQVAELHAKGGTQAKLLRIYLSLFKTQIDNVVQSLQNTIKEERLKQQTNSDIVRQVAEIKKKIELLNNQVRQSTELWENLS